MEESCQTYFFFKKRHGGSETKFPEEKSKIQI